MPDNKNIIIVRRIQVLIDSRDKAFVSATLGTLLKWQHICFKASNYIFTHHYLQDTIKELIYVTDGVKVKLADYRKEENGILTTSRQNTTYRLLANRFKGELPMHILSSLNNRLVSQYNRERNAYREGERAIRNYKRDTAIPFKGEDIRHLTRTPDQRNFTFSLFGIPFRTYLGSDRYDKPVLLDGVCNGSVALCSSFLKLRKGKLFLLAYFKKENGMATVNGDVVAEASLSIEMPLVVKIGTQTFHIGNKEEFLYRRLAIQAARQRIQSAVTYNKGGHGRKRKLQVLQRYREKEKNYTEHKLHLYSKRLIDLCLQHNAGTILLSFQREKEAIAKEDAFLLRNWSYYSLKEKIGYKAARAGIRVIAE